MSSIINASTLLAGKETITREEAFDKLRTKDYPIDLCDKKLWSLDLTFRYSALTLISSVVIAILLSIIFVMGAKDLKHVQWSNLTSIPVYSALFFSGVALVSLPIFGVSFHKKKKHLNESLNEEKIKALLTGIKKEIDSKCETLRDSSELKKQLTSLSNNINL